MSFYSYSRENALQLPIRFFWLASKNIDRIEAERGYKLTLVGAGVQSGESMANLLNELKTTMGKIVVFEDTPEANVDKLDRAGLMALKDLGRF